MTGRPACILLLALLACAARGEEEPPPGPWFVDVAAARGLPAPAGCHRSAWVDLDGDGWFDLCLDNQRLFQNVPGPSGGRRFQELEGALGLCEGLPRPDLILWADLDADGDADAFLGFQLDPGGPDWKDPGHRNQIRIQEGGRFVRRPAPALELAEAPTCGAWLDYDRDGWLDLALGQNYRQAGVPLEAWPLRLFRGGPEGFQEVTAAAGLSQRPEPGHPDSRRCLFGLTACDQDGDGWPDLLCAAYGRQANLLYRNRGDGTFSEVGEATGFAGDAERSGVYPESTKRMWRERFKEERQDELPFRSHGNSFEAAPGDYDGDGDLDLFLAEITHAWAGPSSDRSSLLENLGPPGFALRRHVEAMPRTHTTESWNQGDLYAGWLDADNDGRLDLLLASGDYPDGQFLRLFQQAPRRAGDAGPAFSDQTARAGFAWESAAQPSLCDYDQDGDVDVLVGASAMRMPPGRVVVRPALFENQASQRPGAGRWLHVRLQARGQNRAGLGARLEVRQRDGFRALRELSGGQGHAGRVDAPAAVFGLGPRARVDLLTIRWPDGTSSQLQDLESDRCLVVRQEGGVLQVGPY